MAAPCKELTDSDGDRLLAAHGQFAVCLICGCKDDLQAHALDHTPADRASKWHIVPLCGPHHAKLHSRFLGQPKIPLPKAVAHFAACAHKALDIPVETLIHRLKFWIPGRNFGWLERAIKINLGIKRKPKGKPKTSSTSVLIECLGRGRKRNVKGSPQTLVRQWPSGDHR